ncbi:NAD(P)H-binding protein [Kibdelosporangium phytohabitans]|uniref:NmrA family transcriptional regulator n=1 Tax=Kibdelosporangium phytohabitans TaxID=860235 RepID=A0A0N9HXS9_9PSEU|nr:NAD(P)H-binding protein [Kibdelosporangium phytohabitans]ALG10227.1 NmrA family transcriptional regulator [Kibdelosporangium phytohabitans]MBE1461251.1 uncharacterized protein YbjT (DUF2867 family) [Kibdelosporangium phytohabitans]
MIVVTGATGNVGTPLVHALEAAGEQVTAVSRNAGVRADLTDPTSLKPALDGAAALFLLTSGELHVAGVDITGVLDVAKASGVRRIVLLSSQGVGTGRHPSGIEDAVVRSGLRWTVLRAGGFNSNTFAWAEQIRHRQAVAAPFGDVALPSIDPADIAGVAAEALRSDGHAGKTYVLTGPAAVSPRQQVAAISEALDVPLRFIEQTRAEALAHLTQFMPEPVAQATLDILGDPTPAEQSVSPDVERVLGRPGRTFADWATRNAAAFR